MKQSPYQLLMGVVLLGTVAFLSWQAGGLAAAGMQYIQSENGPGEQKQAVVVIDPGHGGTDPGKAENVFGGFGCKGGTYQRCGYRAVFQQRYS